MYGTLNTSQFLLATFQVHFTALNLGKALQIGTVLPGSAGNFLEEGSLLHHVGRVGPAVMSLPRDSAVEERVPKAGWAHDQSRPGPLRPLPHVLNWVPVPGTCVPRHSLTHAGGTHIPTSRFGAQPSAAPRWLRALSRTDAAPAPLPRAAPPAVRCVPLVPSVGARRQHNTHSPQEPGWLGLCREESPRIQCPLPASLCQDSHSRLHGRQHQLRFTYGKAEAQKGLVACPGSHSRTAGRARS